MVRKYNIDELKYIYSLKHKRKAIVFYDKSISKYVDIDSNTRKVNCNKRLYKEENILLLGDLNKLLGNYGIWVLLINSKGEKQLDVSADVINNLMEVFKKISSLNNTVINEIEQMSNLVTDICINNISIPKEGEPSLRKLLCDYIFVDTAINGLSDCKLVITKEDKMIDYKILRSLKYIGIDINVEDIPDFRIEYNLEGINYCDAKGNKTVEGNLDKEELEKVKKFVDKRSN